MQARLGLCVDVEVLGCGGDENEMSFNQILFYKGSAHAPSRPVGSGIGGMTLVVETNFRVIAFTQVRI